MALSMEQIDSKIKVLEASIETRTLEINTKKHLVSYLQVGSWRRNRRLLKLQLEYWQDIKKARQKEIDEKCAGHENNGRTKTGAASPTRLIGGAY